VAVPPPSGHRHRHRRPASSRAMARRVLRREWPMALRWPALPRAAAPNRRRPP